MLDRKDKIEMMDRVESDFAELYWKFRDDVDDEGGKRLEEELDYFCNKVINILEKYPS